MKEAMKFRRNKEKKCEEYWKGRFKERRKKKDMMCLNRGESLCYVCKQLTYRYVLWKTLIGEA